MGGEGGRLMYVHGIQWMKTSNFGHLLENDQFTLVLLQWTHQ